MKKKDLKVLLGYQVSQHYRAAHVLLHYLPRYQTYLKASLPYWEQETEEEEEEEGTLIRAEGEGVEEVGTLDKSG